jgi:hypothetical protein
MTHTAPARVATATLLNWIARALAIGLAAVALSSCAAVEAQRAEQQKKQESFVHRLDIAHIFVTPEDPPSNKPFIVLGEVNYSEPFTPEAINEDRIKGKLKSMAYAKWPDTLDALVKEKSDVSDDGTTVKVSAEAIQYESSTDREKLHNMNNGLVVSQ